MQTEVRFLSRFLTKLFEIVGAGLASAAGAFLLGHIATPVASPSVVQIVPADAETIRMVRGDQAAVDQLRKEFADTSATAIETVPPTAAAKVETPVRTVHGPAARREHKAVPARAVAHKEMAVAHKEMPVRLPPVAASESAEQPAASRMGEIVDLAPPVPPAPAEASGGGGHFRLFAALRQIPAWFLPGPDQPAADAPRPPMPVGQFWQSAM